MMFMYFYGLERRFMLDHPPPDEGEAILAEVERLAAGYPANRSVQSYMGRFIDVGRLLYKQSIPDAPLIGPRGSDLPLSLKAGIGLLLADAGRLPAPWARAWLLSHPEHSPRQPARRCPEEFAALFDAEFARRYPDGLPVKAPKRQLSETYHAASGEFEAAITTTAAGATLPDISGLRAPLQKFEQIADRCAVQLDGYSRLVGRRPEARGSLEADRLLPEALRGLVPSPARDRVSAWARDVIDGGGQVSVGEALEKVLDEAPERVGKRELTRLAELLEHVGIGLAPDPRHALRWPGADGTIVLYPRDNPFDAAAPSALFRANLAPIALGALVAQADGEVSAAERATFLAQLDAIGGLSPGERAALRAQLAWDLAVPSDLALMRRRLKEASAIDTAAIRTALVAAAQADGFVHAREVAGIEKLYATLGLDPSLAYADLHARDEPVTMRPAQKEAAGELIPPQRPRGALDPARVAVIRADTARVSQVLGGIFAADEPPPEPPAPPTAAALPGLDATLQPILEAVLRGDIPDDAAFDRICAEHSSLPLGALEAINEWAFDAYGDALIERHDGLNLEHEIAAAIRADLEEGADAEAKNERA